MAVPSSETAWSRVKELFPDIQSGIGNDNLCKSWHPIGQPPWQQDATGVLMHSVEPGIRLEPGTKAACELKSVQVRLQQVRNTAKLAPHHSQATRRPEVELHHSARISHSTSRGAHVQFSG